MNLRWRSNANQAGQYTKSTIWTHKQHPVNNKDRTRQNPTTIRNW